MDYKYPIQVLKKAGEKVEQYIEEIQKIITHFFDTINSYIESANKIFPQDQLQAVEPFNIILAQRKKIYENFTVSLCDT